MKKVLTSVMLLMLAVTASFAAKPVELKEWKSSTYNCAYFDWWYFGSGESSRFGFVIFDENGKEVAFTLMSPEEADMCAYYDDVTFPEPKDDRDVEAHYYISTYWVLNSPNGVRWAGGEEGADIPDCVYENKDNNGNSLYALHSGTYYFRVMEMIYNSETGKMTMGSGYDQVKFTLNGTEVRNLQAEVAADKKTATITWEAPTLPYGTHLYMSVQSGGDVAFDNYSQNVSPKSPLTVGVVEGRTYSVSAQYVNSAKAPMGPAMVIYFTVGTNPYIPTNLKATVTKEDYVEFTWTATAKADYYHVNIYRGKSSYASYTTTEQKLSKQLPTGTYHWEVAAYEKAEELFYPLTEYVKGNEFTTESAPLPEGTIEMNVWGMNAAYLATESSAGKYAWVVMFETGAASGTGMPEPWIAIYVDRELALSGNYSPALGNLDISANQGEGTFINTNGSAAGLLQATDARMKLEFEGFDTEYVMAGYSIPYYSGEFFMTCSDGKNYYGKINSLICPAFPWEEMSSSSKNIISMLGEDGSAVIPSDPVIPGDQGLEGVQNTEYRVQKLMENGQVVIVREGVKYNVLGGRIK